MVIKGLLFVGKVLCLAFWGRVPKSTVGSSLVVFVFGFFFVSTGRIRSSSHISLVTASDFGNPPPNILFDN